MLSQSCSTLYIVYITSSPGLTDQNKTRYNTMCIFIPRSYPTCTRCLAGIQSVSNHLNKLVPYQPDISDQTKETVFTSTCSWVFYYVQ